MSEYTTKEQSEKLVKVLPDNIQFTNDGYFDLKSVNELPEKTKFNNGGCIYITSLKNMRRCDFKKKM